MFVINGIYTKIRLLDAYPIALI